MSEFYCRPAHYKRTYDIIHNADAAVDDFYNNKNNRLLALSVARISDRHIREERRWAITNLLKVMINHLDIRTFQVSFLSKNNKYPISIEKLAELSKMGVRRTERALHDLKAAGYIFFKIRVKKYGRGLVKHLVAIKQLSDKLFIDLGISYKKIFKVKEYAKMHTSNTVVDELTSERNKYKLNNLLKNIIKKPYKNKTNMQNINEYIKPAGSHPLKKEIDYREKLSVNQKIQYAIELSKLAIEMKGWPTDMIRETAYQRVINY